MNGLLRLIFVLLIGGIVVSSKVYSQTAEWKQTDSENFRVLSNAKEEDTERLISRIEDFRRGFFKLFGQNQLKSPIPTRILIFKSSADASEILNSQTFAKNHFREGHDANYIVVALNGADTDLSWIYHQYFHYLISNHIGKSKIPAWLNEGLAQIYENFQTNGELKASFRNSESRYNILKQSKLLPSEILFNTDYYTLNQQETHGTGVFYLQSFALVEYLISQDDGEKFARLVSLLSSGISLNESLIKSFQFDVPTAEKNLISFIGSKPKENIPAAKKTVSQTADLKFSPISQAETESYLGDFFYQSERFDKAELYLLKSLSLTPLAVFPKSTLGLVKLRQYKIDEALRNLKEAVEYKDADFLTYYRCAYALSRQGMTEYGFISNYDVEKAQKIRGLLDQAINLNPEFSEAYNLYALIDFVRNEESERGLEFIAKALKSAPANDWYLLRKAELDMRQENFTQARKIAIEVYRNASNEGLRLYAQNTIQRIDSTEYQLLQSRRREKLPYSDAISEKPFSDEEIARLRAKAVRESLTTALRLPASDEKRILGSIVKIDCRQNQVQFTVKTGDQLIKLYAESFEALKLMTFNSLLSKSQIGCGMVNVENAVIIFKNAGDSNSDISGEIVSVEFVPKDFTFSVRSNMEFKN